MRNTDVQWQGTFLGALPTVRGATNELLQLQQLDRQRLLRAVCDAEKYIAAHVVLTLTSELPWSGDATTWNELKLSVSSHGAVHVEPREHRRLIKLWGASCGLASNNSFQRTSGLRPLAAELMIRYAAGRQR